MLMGPPAQTKFGISVPAMRTTSSWMSRKRLVPDLITSQPSLVVDSFKRCMC